MIESVNRSSEFGPTRDQGYFQQSIDRRGTGRKSQLIGSSLGPTEKVAIYGLETWGILRSGWDNGDRIAVGQDTLSLRTKKDMSCALYARLLNDSTDTTPTDVKGLLQILLPPSLVTYTVGSFPLASSLNAQGLESMYSPSHEEAVPSSLNQISLSVSPYLTLAISCPCLLSCSQMLHNGSLTHPLYAAE